MTQSRATLELPLRKTEQLLRAAEAAAKAYGGVSRESLARALERSAASRFPRGAPPQDVAAYLDSLQLEDLALAVACADGSEPAWQHFIESFRPGLYAAARGICRSDEAAARELADSLYADLFGLKETEAGERRSLFQYFHGRSKLSTWLHAVLAQRHVDALRAARRSEVLDESDSGPAAPAQAAQVAAPLADPRRAEYLERLQTALTAALGKLPPRDRLRLASYYLQQMTLAEIGRALGEHEATVSRQLERTRRELRHQVDAALRAEARLSEAQIELCYEYALEEWPFDLARALSGPREAK
jgi:RNA polymerase sigma-70 factor (ECF subfamily)